MKSTNPESKEINQKRGPTTGNGGNPTKRKEFIAEKAHSSSEKGMLAKMVTDALEMRGRGQAATPKPALEGLHSNTGPKRNLSLIHISEPTRPY